LDVGDKDDPVRLFMESIPLDVILEVFGEPYRLLLAEILKQKSAESEK